MSRPNVAGYPACLEHEEIPVYVKINLIARETEIACPRRAGNIIAIGRCDELRAGDERACSARACEVVLNLRGGMYAVPEPPPVSDAPVARRPPTRPLRLDPARSLAEQQAEWVVAAQGGNQDAAAAALTSVSRMITKQVNEFARSIARAGIRLSTEDREDMTADARLFLIRYAIPSYKPDRSAWTTWSRPHIFAAIRRWFRQRWRIVRIPERKVERKILDQLARDSATDDVAAFTLSLIRSHSTFRLDARISAENTGKHIDRLIDPYPNPEERLIANESVTIRDLRAAIAALPGRMQFIINGRLRGRTLEEIGAALGLTKERTRQLQHRAMARLKRVLRRNVE